MAEGKKTNNLQVGVNLWSPPPQVVAEEFISFGEKLKRDYFEQVRLRIDGSDEKQKLIPREKLFGLIKRKLANKEPGCCIRISDGEGNLLGLDSQFGLGENLRDWCARRISYIHFGDESIVFRGSEFFLDMIKGAVEAADVIGFPEIHRIEEMYSQPYPDVDVRAVVGNRIGAMTLNLLLDGDRSVQFGSAWLNRQLLPYFSEILRSAEKIVVVTSYESLPLKLVESFGLVESFVQHIAVPTQAVFQPTRERADTRHYPDGMHKIVSEIRAVDGYALVLVAAGLLGKHYCRIARQCGHLAIDIGSVPEIWLGIQARGLPKDYIEKWQL